MHLIDTSVWIDFLRGSPHPKVRYLEGLLDEGEAGLCGVTFAEICFGAKDEAQFKKYHRDFSSLPFLDPPGDWPHQMARIGYQLREKGRKPFVADLLIALTALHHHVPLLTNDSDFEPYRDLFGLVLE